MWLGRVLGSKLTTIIGCFNYTSKGQIAYNIRSYSQNPSFPSLTTLDIHEWPEIWLWCKTFMLTRAVIPYYFDKEFIMADFVRGSKKAVEVVTDHISKNNLDGLKGLVTDDVINEVGLNLPKFTPQQKEQLKADEKDMILVFPYEAGIINHPKIPEKMNNLEVEITMIYHIYLGLDEKKKDELFVYNQTETFQNIMNLPDYKEKTFILNYRFLKDFSTDEDWIINGLNHGKLKNFMT